MSERITEEGINNDVIYDSAGTPLLVRIPQALTEEQAGWYSIQSSHPAADVPVTAYTGHQEEISATLPHSVTSGLVYPKRLTTILDALLQGSWDDPDSRAVYLHTAEAVPANGSGEAGEHFDSPDSPKNLPTDIQYGFNAHLTLHGRGAARFALLNSSDAVGEVLDFFASASQDINALGDKESDVAKRMLRWRNLEVLKACREYFNAAPTSEWIELTPGDMVAFQAAPHLSRGLLPVIHRFDTLGPDKREYAVFLLSRDRAGPTDRQRLEAAQKYGLQYAGY